MTKVYYILLSLLLVSFITACTFSWNTTHENSITLTYSGRVVFEPTGDAIGAISPNGFLTFINSNNKKLDIKSDKKHALTYQLNNGSITAKPTDEEKAIVAEAFKYGQQTGSIAMHSPFILDDKAQK